MKTISCIVALWIVSVRLVNADHVDDVISAQMKLRRIPGVALAVIEGGKIIREQAYGFADEANTQPVSPTTLFQAASVSKPVAALGALHLVEQGRVSLDGDIDPKLRSWHLPRNRFTHDHPVTLRLILSHSADGPIPGAQDGGYIDGPPRLRGHFGVKANRAGGHELSTERFYSRTALPGFICNASLPCGKRALRALVLKECDGVTKLAF